MTHANRLRPFVPLLFLAGALGAVALWSLLSAQRLEAAPRAITPRGELTAEERQNIDVFESWKGSVVFISTSERVVDFWSRNVMSVPRGTGSGFVWDGEGHVVTNVHVIANAAEALGEARRRP